MSPAPLIRDLNNLRDNKHQHHLVLRHHVTTSSFYHFLHCTHLTTFQLSASGIRVLTFIIRRASDSWLTASPPCLNISKGHASHPLSDTLRDSCVTCFVTGSYQVKHSVMATVAWPLSGRPLPMLLASYWSDITAILASDWSQQPLTGLLSHPRSGLNCLSLPAPASGRASLHSLTVRTTGRYFFCQAWELANILNTGQLCHWMLENCS